MAEETRCVLRLYGAPQGRLAAAVALFAPQWRAEAQWKSRGAETLLAVHADTPTGLKKAAQSLRSSFGADVYGAGDTSLAAAAVQALEAMIVCWPAAMPPPVRCWNPGSRKSPVPRRSTTSEP